MYICLCHGITDHQIRSCVIETGARTLCELSGRLGVATQCGSCASSACDVLTEVLASTIPLAVLAADPATAGASLGA